MSMDEKMNSLLKTAIVQSGKLRKNSKYLKNVYVTKINRLNVGACDNLDSNYSFKGDVVITVNIPTQDGINQHEFPCCEISGFALIENNEVNIINGVSIDSGLPRTLQLEYIQK